MAAVLCASTAAATELAVGLDAGYAFRSHDDGRNHGASASLFLDVPLPGALGSVLALRPELTSLGFGGSTVQPSSLGLIAASLSLVYSFDDTQAEALAAVGPLGAVSIDTAGLGVHGGLLTSLGLRLPIAEVASLDVRLAAPFIMAGRGGFHAPGQSSYADGSPVELPLQAAFLIGFSLQVDEVFAVISGA